MQILNRHMPIGAALFGILFLISCYQQPTPVLPPKAIPPLETRVYSAGNVDWSKYQRIRLDLREKGSPDESRNQILEEFLITQATQLMSRKGYSVVDSDAPATLRIYFSVSEKDAQTTEVKSITYASQQNQSSYISSISLLGGLWQTASVSTASWNTVALTKYYEAEITLELYDSASNRQLWRGDVFIPIDSRDIRVSSNYMFRDLLWSFPAVSYPSVTVPRADSSEFETLWESFLDNREFFVPGLRHHISFIFKEKRAAQSEAEATFKTTNEYQNLKKSERPWEVIENTKEYREAFLKWYESEGHELASNRAKATLKPHTEVLPAIIDLLQTSPVAYKDTTGQLHLVGHYEMMSENKYLHIVASAQKQPYIFMSGTTRYFKTKYHVSVVELLPEEEYLYWLQLAQDQRTEALGNIDTVGDLSNHAGKK